MIKINKFISSFVLLVGLCIVLSQNPCGAIPWSNKPLPRINTQSKIDYVNISWWDNFSDPYLKCYIIQAIENNHDAKKASWTVEEYKHQVKVQFSKELPTITGGTTYILNHLQDVLPATKTNVFTVPFVASYEADVFLKNHDKTKSSKKAYESSKFQEQSVYISLASDVATSYINLIKFDKLIQTQQEIVKVKNEELKREQHKYRRGTTNVPKLNDVKKNYNTAKSALDDYIKSRDKTLNQLALLIGESAENASSLKRNSWDNFNYSNTIPAEIPSDVLFSRPDIMAAETNLEKSKIDVRVARKEFLPRININGIYAFSNLGSTGFGSWNSTLAALAAGATLDLFKGGYKVANLKVYKAKYEQMFEAYQQTDLTAIKEVNDSLIIIKEDEKINKNAFENYKIQSDNFSRSKNSYKNGVISYLELLVQQETLLNSRQNEINTKTTCFTDYITLYKAVGGKL